MINDRNKLTVLQIVNGYFGASLYESMFEALGSKGINSTIYVPINKNDKCDLNSRLYSNTDVYVSKCFSTFDRILYFPKQRKIYSDLKSSFDMKKYNVVHAHTVFSAGYAAMCLKKAYGIPYIVAVRNVDLNFFFNKIPLLRGIGVKILMNASKIVFLSAAYKNNVIGNYVPKDKKMDVENKSVIIPNGINKIFISNRGTSKVISKKNIKLIYAGEINRNKNIEQIISAAKILMCRNYQVLIMCIGDVTDNACKRLVKNPFVMHYQGCSQQQLLDYYRQADIFVMVSHAETFGLVYAEAISQGLPVLYTRGQGFDGQFDEGEVGYSVSDKDAAELADKIELVINQYDNISNRCVQRADKFDWKMIAKQYLEIYKEIMEND